MQSIEADAFSAADLSVLQVLADQLAVAIQNTRLVDQLQKTLDELSIFTRQGVEDAWRRVSSQAGEMAFEYDRLEIKSARPFSLLPVSDEAPNRRVIPIRLREQLIGFIGIESDEPDRTWTEDEISVLSAAAEHAALTIENARLLAESQQKGSPRKAERRDHCPHPFYARCGNRHPNCDERDR